MKATKVKAGLAESNGRLLLGIWSDSFHVTCGLTASTPGSAPGPTLGNEYEKTLPFNVDLHSTLRALWHVWSVNPYENSTTVKWAISCYLPAANSIAAVLPNPLLDEWRQEAGVWTRVATVPHNWIHRSKFVTTDPTCTRDLYFTRMNISGSKRNEK